MHATHEVFNQPELLVDYNLFETNRPLRLHLHSQKLLHTRCSDQE